MSDEGAALREALAHQEARARRLAGEKADLQLVVSLMSRLNRMPGLESIAATLLEIVIDSIGGTHASLYLFVEDEIRYVDLAGTREVVTSIRDPLVTEARETLRLAVQHDDFHATLMQTVEFAEARSWAVPLLAGSELVGIFKVEGLHLVSDTLETYLAPFFQYVALVLRNEILSQSRLKSAEEKLKSAQYARSLLEASLDPLVTISEDGRVTDVNQATVVVTGVPRERLIGTDFSDYFTDPVAARVGYETVWRDGSVRDYPLSIRHVSGRVVNVLYNATLYRDPEGRPLGVFAAARDVTERERAEAALRESEEKHRRLFETMAQGVVYQAADGAILSANPAAERILGLSIDQLTGKTSLDPNWRAVREDGSELPGHEHPAMVALRTGAPVGPVVMGVYQPLRSDHAWLSVTSIPLFQPGAETPFQVHTTFDDVTERHLAEERYRQLFLRMIDGFALHELLLDEQGQPTTYRFLEVNPAFERLGKRRNFRSPPAASQAGLTRVQDRV